MINENEMIDDPRTDKVGKLIKELSTQPKWNKEKISLKEKLISEMEKEKYQTFWGHSKRYHLYEIGSGYLYKVPENKRGNLKVFRGQLVRIVCIGQNRFDRVFMVGKVKI